MSSSFLDRPLRSESEVTSAVMDRLIARAESLVSGVQATAASLDHGARGEALAFANLVTDALGDTLKAWKLSRENERDEKQGWGRDLGGASL